MALAIIPTIIVSFVVIVALLSTYYIYHAYKRVRFAVPDVERNHHVENLEHHKRPSIQLHDIESPHRTYQSGQWYGSENVVPTHVSPVAKALPRISEVEYTGGEGLVSPPGRVFLSSNDAKAGNRKENGLDKFQAQALHAGRPWNFATDGYGSSMVDQPGLGSPKPVRTVPQKSPKAEPITTAYDPAQTAAANIWDKINKGELKPSRRKAEKTPSKLLIATAPEVPRDPANFENDILQNIDLGSSTKEWAKARVSSAYVTKRPSKRDSFDSTITAFDVSDVNIERPASYVKCKQSIDTDIVKLPQPLDQTAEVRRKILEAKEQMANRKKREEEERQAEERRQAEEQNQRVAEQQKLSEEKKRQDNEERARSLAEVTKTEDKDLCDTNTSRSRRSSASRRSNSSTKSKSARNSRERPLPRSPKRAYTFANDTTPCVNDSITKKPSSSRSRMARSMSMNGRERQDTNATMAPIAEGNGTDDTNERDLESSRTTKIAKPFSDSMSRRSDGSNTSASSGCSYKYNHGRRISKDIPENPFTSIQDAKVSFAPTQRSSGSSSIESRSQAQRRSNASRNDSRLSSDSRLSPSHPERNNKESSAEFRASADSQSSTHSIADRGKPERKSSFASRTLGKLGRKSSSSEKKKESGSADLVQFGEHDGPGMRGGAMVFVAEPGMSESDNEHEDWRHRYGQDEDAVRMRGGAGEKMVESGNESEAGVEKDGDSDAGKDAHSDDGHSEDDNSEDEHSEDEPSESDGDIEEQDSSEDEVFEDNASENEHSESEVSNDEVSDAGTSDDESGDEGSDGGNEQALLQKPAKIVSTKTIGMVKA